MKIMDTTNGYINTARYIDNQLIENSSAMNDNQMLQNSIDQQQYCNKITQLNQINQLSYIDDYQANSSYADLKLSDDLQRLQVDEQLEQLKHWSTVVYDCNSIQLFEWNVAGGADYGQLFYFIDSGDIILEIDGVKISGFTRNDVLNLIKKQQYHFLKAVSSSSSFGLNIDLKEYLSRRFVRASIDHELQSTIRENVYIRTIPFTTRMPKPNEVSRKLFEI